MANTKRRLGLAALILATTSCSAVPLRAATYDFSFEASEGYNPRFEDSGTFSTADTPLAGSTDAFAITSISDRFGSNLPLVSDLPPGTLFSGADSYLFNFFQTSTRLFNVQFAAGNEGTIGINNLDGVGAYALPGVREAGTLTITASGALSPVPLPAAASLFGAALLALGGFGHIRIRKLANAKAATAA